MKHPNPTYQALFLFSLAFLIQTVRVQAQDFIANVQFYNHKNGLVGRFPNCTFKDSRGVMWIGGEFGLTRFDGRDFVQFDYERGLPIHSVNEIHEDSEGWLWLFTNCLTRSGGGCIKSLGFIHSVSLETQSFQAHFGERFNFLPEEIVSLLTAESGDIYMSAKGQIIRWSEGRVLQKIQLEEGEETPNLLGIVAENKIAGWHYEPDEKGNLRIVYKLYDSNGKVIYKKNLSLNFGGKKRVKPLRLDKDYLGRRIMVYGFYVASPEQTFLLGEDGRLLEGTSDWTLLPKSGQVAYHPEYPQAWLSDYKNSKALSIYSPEKGLTYDFGAHFPIFKHDLYIRQIQFDENDITWVTCRYGVFRIQLKRDLFRRILYHRGADIEAPNKVYTNTISSLNGEQMVFSTQPYLYLLNIRLDKAPKIIDTVELRTPFFKGYEGDYWTASINNIIRINASNLRIKKYPIPEDRPFKDIIWSAISGNHLLLGADEGLFYYDIVEQQIFPVKIAPEFKGTPLSGVRFIYKEGEGKFFICTSGGLYGYAPDKGIFVHYSLNEKLTSAEFFHLSPAKKGGWWLASIEGLAYWNPHENVVELFNTENGLPTNLIRGVYEDDYGFLWLSTVQGLIQFQIESGLSKVWLEADGVPDRYILRKAHCRNYDGSLWFGTMNGIMTFHPRDFKDIDLAAQPEMPLNILDFEQFSIKTGKLENRMQQLLKTQRITLQPGEQLFNLRVALADYVTGADAKYSYRIEGVQDFWLEGAENLIRISGLPYGNYNLEIKGRLANGQYSSQEIRLPIQVLKPFYLKTWFLALGIFFFLMSSVVFFFWRTARLKRAKAKLETEVANRTATIEQQSEKLRHLDKLKSRFFANVSHELRTPLTLLLGPINTAMKTLKPESSVFPHLKLARQNAQKLLQLTNEIMDLTKLESGKMELQEEPVLLFPLLCRLVANFESLAKNQRIKLSLDFRADEQLQVQLDAAKFETIGYNLLSNALKFTPTEQNGSTGEVKVSLEDKGDLLLFEVADTGQGIHPDDLPNIFNRFYQTTQSNAPAQGGTGIGLALCRELAMLFHGKIWAESSLGQGSAFLFEFPKKEVVGTVGSMQSAIGSEQLVIGNSEKVDLRESLLQQDEAKLPTANYPLPTVLIVEDNADLRGCIQQILNQKYELLTAENGKAALELLNSPSPPDPLKGELPPAPVSKGSGSPFRDEKAFASGKKGRTASRGSVDLIISDIMMPVMDGFQLLEKLKGGDRWRHLPVIMLTARAEMRDKLKALRIGVDDYLTKPFEEAELHARIENLLRNYRQRMELFSGGEEAQSRPVIAKVDAEWLEEVEIVFSKNLSDGNFKMDFAANRLNLSLRQFQRRIKLLTGLTANAYLQEMRLQGSKDFLQEGKYATVKEVGFAVGFRSTKYFSALFQERFGLAPSSYFR